MKIIIQIFFLLLILHFQWKWKIENNGAKQDFTFFF